METMIVQKLLSSLVEGSVTYGPFTMLLTYLWLSERSERRKYQSEQPAMLERILNALNGAKSAVDAGVQSQTAVLTTLNTVKDFLFQRGQKL